jgi:hypothetical protein
MNLRKAIGMAAKERKEHIDKTLCDFFFVIFVLFCGQFVFGCCFSALYSFVANNNY